ncbi:MAG TPA: hypothetical protein VFQ38_00685 [Longimicrobiales bacterium]|nr:hypothetical protein [Longimicrobiales bacterium]
MPIDTVVRPRERLIEVIGLGAGTFGEYREAFSTVCGQLRRHRGFAVLCNFEHYRNTPSWREALRLIEVGRRRAAVFAAGLAIVTQPNIDFRMAELLSLHAQSQGIQVQVFTNGDAARRWLKR